VGGQGRLGNILLCVYFLMSLCVRETKVDGVGLHISFVYVYKRAELWNIQYGVLIQLELEEKERTGWDKKGIQDMHTGCAGWSTWREKRTGRSTMGSIPFFALFSKLLYYTKLFCYLLLSVSFVQSFSSVDTK
jgi:hypothetical protein